MEAKTFLGAEDSVKRNTPCSQHSPTYCPLKKRSAVSWTKIGTQIVSWSSRRAKFTIDRGWNPLPHKVLASLLHLIRLMVTGPPTQLSPVLHCPPPPRSTFRKLQDGLQQTTFCMPFFKISISRRYHWEYLPENPAWCPRKKGGNGFPF